MTYYGYTLTEWALITAYLIVCIVLCTADRFSKRKK